MNARNLLAGSGVLVFVGGAWLAASANDGSEAAVAAIVRRNVFNHGEPVPGEGEPPELAPANRCSLPIDLVGAVLVHTSPTLSFVTIRDRGATPPRVDVFQSGERIGPTATLAAVHGDPDDPARLESIEIAFDDGHRERCAATSATSSPGAKPGDAPAIGGARVVVAAAELDAAIRDGFRDVAGQVHAVPAEGGWRLSFASDSLPGHAGLKSGDVVKRVNGYALASPQDAITAFGVLRSERNLSVDLVRDGHPQTLEIAVR